MFVEYSTASARTSHASMIDVRDTEARMARRNRNKPTSLTKGGREAGFRALQLFYGLRVDRRSLGS